MTFSDPHVRKLLNNKFHCAWVDTNGQKCSGGSFAHEPGSPAGTCIRGNGKQNIQMLTMTPQGKIFHVISGFIGPKDLREQLAFALTLFKRNKREVVTAHKGELERLETRDFSGQPLGRLVKHNYERDHKFVIEHPLLDIQAFRPEMLVGNGRSFFGSSVGVRPEDMIGDPIDMERLRDMIKIKKGRKDKEDPKGDSDE